MLDMNTIEITKLASEYAKGKVMYLILGIGLIFLSIMFFFAIYKMFYAYDDEICFFPIVFAFVFVCIGFNLMANNYVKFCQVTIKVIPTENLTIEQMKKSDKFIEKDGDYYYVKTFKRYILLESDRMFTSNQGRLLRETEQDFNDFVNTNYLKYNAVHIEDRGL